MTLMRHGVPLVLAVVACFALAKYRNPRWRLNPPIGLAG